MKRPLKPSDVPPGSVFRQETTFKPGEYCIPSSVREHGIHLLTEFFSWEDLKNSLWRILRPGEDWQPCWVDEFNPADYKPGQEVSFDIAKKLDAAGVRLQFYEGANVWVDSYGGESMNGGLRYRIALPPKLRNIRPDELPFIFQIEYNDGSRRTFFRCSTTPKIIALWVAKSKGYRVHENGPIHSFQLEDE